MPDVLARLASPWAYVAVGLLAALEASAFVGLFVPGELALLVGSSYRRVEHYAGQASLMVVLALAIIAGVVVGARWVARHQDEAHRLVRRVPVLSQLARLGRHLSPGRARWLTLVLQLVVLVGAGWVVGVIVSDLAGGESPPLDGPLARYVVTHREPWLTAVMRAVTWLGSSAVLIPLAVVVGLAARRVRGSWSALGFLATAVVGAGILDDVVKSLVDRPRPTLAPLVRTTNSAFPSGHALQAITGWGALALVAGRWLSTWTAKVALWTAALVIVLAVGFSRVYLGVHWPSDVLGGYALGAAWLTAVAAPSSWRGDA